MQSNTKPIRSTFHTLNERNDFYDKNLKSLVELNFEQLSIFLDNIDMPLCKFLNKSKAFRGETSNTITTKTNSK